MAFVLDASVTGAWIFEDEKTPETQALLDSLGFDSAYCPALWPTEVANTLQVGIRKSRVSLHGALDFLRRLRNLPISVMPQPSSYAPLLTSAITHGLTVYDATYLDLALEYGIPLATNDKEMRAAAAKMGVTLLP